MHPREQTIFALSSGRPPSAIARFADQVTIRTETMETIAGFLLIGGFAAIGCALPSI